MAQNIVEQRLFNTKLRLYITVGIATLVDLFLTIILIANGIFNLHMVLSAIMVGLDALLILAIVKSNFRFKYSRFIPLAYLLISLVVSIAIVPMLGAGIFTNVAFFASMAMHVVSAITLFVCVFDAGRLGKKITVIAVLLIVILTAVSAGYCAMTISNGYYGQGGFGYRSLVYEYDSEAEGYKVIGIVDGNAQRVVIPAEYNGKKISAIDCSIFTDEVLTTVDFACATDVKLLSVSELANKNDNIAVNISKDNIDAFKGEIVELIEDTENADERANYAKLYNSIVPSGLNDDEVYITFDYSATSFADAEYEVIKTWIGKKGDTFNLVNHTDVEYVEGYDLSSEAFLRYSYDNYNRRVMQTIQNGSTVLDGAKINSSLSNVNITFEDVYRITIGEDNDTLYESSNTFKQHADTDYRYLLGADNSNILSGIELRDGFTLKWEYSNAGQTDRSALTTLSSVLSEGVTVYPVWTLKAPQITELKSDKTDNLHIYGDNINLSTLATAPNSDVELSYKWISDDIDVGVDKTQSTLTLTNVKPEKTGTYTIEVTASSTTSTSLTSKTTKTINVTVNKKPLGFTWTLPNAVYSGVDKAIVCEHVSADVINGDTITKTLNLDSVRNVGDYNFEVSLTGACAELYEIKSENKTNAITITPYEKEVVWVGSAYTYNGQLQGPTATLTGIGTDNDIAVTVSGLQKDTNIKTDTQKYTATVATTNKNYLITNKEHDFTIAQKALTFNWTNTEFIYNGENHNPTAIVINAEVGDDIGLTYSAPKKDYSATAYTCTITVGNQNYSIETGHNTHTFTIAQREINLIWQGDSFVYNGKSQHSTAVGDNVVSGDVVTFVYTNGENVNKGSYTVNATAINNNNYKFVSGATLSKNYAITARPLTITWNYNSLVYNGVEQKPTETIANNVNGDDLQISYSTKYVNVGSNYNFTISVGNANYYIEDGATTTYSITKKPLTLNWQSTSFTFNGSNQYPTVSNLVGICGEDVVNISYANYGKDAGTHTVKATIDNDNYEITTASASKTYAIAQHGVTITWSNLTFTYDKTQKLPTATTEGINESIIVTVTGAKTNAGTYVATADISSYTNYKIAENATTNFTISKKDVTVVWDSVDAFTYNGSNQYPQVTINGVIDGDTVGAKYANYGKNAGSYVVNLTGVDNDNYNVATSQVTSKSYTINPKTLTYTWGATTQVYNGNAFKPSITFEGFVNGETVSILNVNYGTAKTDVGSYTCEVTFANNNYTLGLGKATSTTFTITPKTVDVVWGNTSLVYNGNAQKPTATAIGVKGESITLVYSDYSSHKDVYTGYYISVATDNSNYSINSNVYYDITPKEVTINWSNFDFTYDATSKKPTATVNGAITGDVVTAFVSGGQINAGSYTATCELDGEDKNNYTIKGNGATFQYSIKKAALTVNFASNNVFTYTGSKIEYTATIEGFKGDDENLITVSYVYKRLNTVVDPINAGSYSVTVSISGENASNYSLSNTMAEFIINRKTVTFTYASDNVFDYDGTAKSFEATNVSGLIGSDIVTYTYYKADTSEALSGAPTEVGSYTVKATVTNSSNYNLSGATANFTINAVETND